MDTRDTFHQPSNQSINKSIQSTNYYYYYYYNNRFTAPWTISDCQGLRKWAGTRKVKPTRKVK